MIRRYWKDVIAVVVTAAVLAVGYHAYIDHQNIHALVNMVAASQKKPQPQAPK